MKIYWPQEVNIEFVNIQIALIFTDGHVIALCSYGNLYNLYKMN